MSAAAPSADRSAETRVDYIFEPKKSQLSAKQMQSKLDEVFAAKYPGVEPFQGLIVAHERAAMLLAEQFSEMELDSSKKPFKLVTYFSKLRTRDFGRHLMHTQSIGSTQALLYDYGSQLADGLVFVADRQEQGRGRRHNGWESPLGCLMFTAKFRVTSFGNLPFVQYIASIAMAQAVLTESEGLLQLSIKWPNDLYYAKRKLGGILCQSSIIGSNIDVYMGIGLNVANSAPVTCLNDILGDMLEEHNSAPAQQPEDGKSAPPPLKSVPQITCAGLLASFCNFFEPVLERLDTRGFFESGLADEYLALWLHTGEKVTVQSKSGKEVPAVIEGLTRQGYLLGRAIDQPHSTFELHPDGNSFDMMKQLLIARDLE